VELTREQIDYKEDETYDEKPREIVLYIPFVVWFGGWKNKKKSESIEKTFRQNISMAIAVMEQGQNC
jgi:hypothetical protein